MLNYFIAAKAFPNSRLPQELKEIEGKVKVSIINGKGRGLIAQQDFEPGELIIANRALEIIFPDPQTINSSSSLLNKVKRFRLLKESLAKLAGGDEEIKRKVYSLSAGPKLGHVEGNKFNCDDKGKVSMARIEGVLIVNGFQGPSISPSSSEGPFGLWYLPAFINHDCGRTNAIWSIVGDFMFIRAVKKIQNGEEILLSYIDPDQPFHTRNELFLKHDFICVCTLCKIEKEEDQAIRDKRDQVLYNFKEYVSKMESPETDCLERILDSLISLRPKQNPFILQPLMHLGLAYYEKKCYKEAINVFERGIQVCKAFVQFTPVASTLAAAILRCYLRLDKIGAGEMENGLMELRNWMKLQYGCESEEECFNLLELVNPTFYLEIKKYTKKE